MLPVSYSKIWSDRTGTRNIGSKFRMDQEMHVLNTSSRSFEISMFNYLLQANISVYSLLETLWPYNFIVLTYLNSSGLTSWWRTLPKNGHTIDDTLAWNSLYYGESWGLLLVATAEAVNLLRLIDYSHCTPCFHTVDAIVLVTCAAVDEHQINLAQ